MTLRGRWTLGTVLVALLAVLLLGVPLAAVESARIRGDEQARLEREADGIAGALEDRVARGLRVDAGALAPLVPAGHRATVRVAGRTVVAGARLDGAVVRSEAEVTSAPRVTVAAPRTEVTARAWRSWGIIAGIAVGAVAVAGVAGAVQARRLARPLEALARTSEGLGEGDFSVRVPRSRVPEIDAIGAALDASARRIAQLVGREREFSANVSHQLRTPLTALRLRLEEAARDPAGEDLAAALREADRLEETVAALLRFARSEGEGRRTAGGLATVVGSHVERWAPAARAAGRRIEVFAGEDATVLASPGTPGQALDVLVENALRHGSGDVRVTLLRDGAWGVVRVEDQGPGVDLAAAEAIFGRGASSNGTGIGLHLARALVEADGGTLRLAHLAPARFELRLRLAPPRDFANA